MPVQPEPTSLTTPAGSFTTGSTSFTIPTHSLAYGYDDAGRKISETSDGRQVSYGYDGAGGQSGSRTRTVWPDGYRVSYAYDALNRMSTVWEGLPNTTQLADYRYDALQRRQRLQYANQANHRVDYTYELDNNLDVLTHVLNTVQVTLDYGYNRSGQITSIATNDDFYLPSPTSNTTTAYVPNKLNQYGSVGGQAASYDAAGNLTAWYHNGVEQTYTYDAENRLRTAATNGTTTPTIFYDYDPLGRRLSKRVGSAVTRYLLDGDEEIAELSDSGVVLRRYIMGPAIDDRIATAEGSSTTSPTKTYYHTNHQGSVIAMADATGRVTGCAAGVNCQRLSYDEYGRLGAGSVTTGQPYRYTGRRFDEETKLYYYRARYYSPELGRFLQTDPIGYEDDVNLYAYVKNDPLNNVDPSGQVCIPCITGGVGAVVGAASYLVATAATGRKATLGGALGAAAAGAIGGLTLNYAASAAAGGSVAGAATAIGINTAGGAIAGVTATVTEAVVDKGALPTSSQVAGGAVTGAALQNLAPAGNALGKLAGAVTESAASASAGVAQGSARAVGQLAEHVVEKGAKTMAEAFTMPSPAPETRAPQEDGQDKYMGPPPSCKLNGRC